MTVRELTAFIHLQKRLDPENFRYLEADKALGELLVAEFGPREAFVDSPHDSGETLRPQTRTVRQLRGRLDAFQGAHWPREIVDLHKKAVNELEFAVDGFIAGRYRLGDFPQRQKEEPLVVHSLPQPLRPKTATSVPGARAAAQPSGSSI